MCSGLTKTEQMLFSLVEARFLGNSLAFYMKIPCLQSCIQVTVANNEDCGLCMHNLFPCLFKALFSFSDFLCIEGYCPIDELLP